jgi:hypothetical protein
LLARRAVDAPKHGGGAGLRACLEAVRAQLTPAAGYAMVEEVAEDQTAGREGGGGAPWRYGDRGGGRGGTGRGRRQLLKPHFSMGGHHDAAAAAATNAAAAAAAAPATVQHQGRQQHQQQHQQHQRQPQVQPQKTYRSTRAMGQIFDAVAAIIASPLPMPPPPLTDGSRTTTTAVEGQRRRQFSPPSAVGLYSC